MSVPLSFNSTNEENEPLLKAIIENSVDIIISKNLDGIITSWNPAAEKAFGYTSEEVIGKHISIIIPKDRLEEEQYIISHIRAGEKIDHFETIRITKYGKSIPVSLSVSPIKDANGVVIGASKIARDISSQKIIEAINRKYIEYLEKINNVSKQLLNELNIEKILQITTDVTTQGIDAKFGAFFYNTVSEEGETYSLYTLSGAPKEAFEHFGMPSNTDVFHPTFSGQTVVRSGNITKDPRYGNNPPHYGMPKGHLPVMSYLAVPVIAISGEVLGGLFYGHPHENIFNEDHERFVVSIAAIAAISLEKANLYREVNDLNRRKDEFIGLASHELKTPLTSMLGYLQILHQMETEQRTQRFIDKCIQQGNKLSGLVDDLLDVSRIEAGKLQFNRSLFDIKLLLEECVELIERSTGTHRITFATTIPNCIIEADQQRIEQVIINLLTNAIKYSPKTKEVEIFCYINDEIKIGIKDFGIGIAKEKQELIFSRFYRSEDIDSTITGLGIGLYISKEIINRHKGKIWVTSQLGNGSTFWITLPKQTSS